MSETNKRLYRSKKDRIIGGVCAGIAEYLNIDPVIVRILFVLALLTEGFGFMLYIILWIVIPEQESTQKESKEVVEENIKEIKGEVDKVTKGMKKRVKSDTKTKK